MIGDIHWRLERIRNNRFIPWMPEAKQAAFIMCDKREALYGGAAGGGKSVALLIAALEWVDVPEYSALLLRRTFQDLKQPKALIPLSQDWLANTDAKWNDNDHQWLFPSGATLTFGYMEAEKDKYRYQGAAYQFVGWDELTQFNDTQYRYLFSRQRRVVGSRIPIRMRSTSNPGGSGHAWVKARFVDPGDPQRPFFPALLHDNPHLDVEEYRSALAELDQATRQQLEYGDWTDLKGSLWSWETIERSRTVMPKEFTRIVVAIDPAVTSNEGSDETGIIVVGLGRDGHGYVLQDISCKKTPDGWAKDAVTAYHQWKADRIIGEVNNGGEMVGLTIKTADVSVPFKAVHASRGKRVRAEPVAALYEQGKVHHVGTFPKLENQMAGFLPEITDASPDRVDALVWAITELMLEGKGAQALAVVRETLAAQTAAAIVAASEPIPIPTTVEPDPTPAPVAETGLFCGFNSCGAAGALPALVGGQSTYLCPTHLSELTKLGIARAVAAATA